jgi:phosphatidylinositol 4-kinase
MKILDVDSRADDSFRILITGEQSGLVETITDAVSVHSIKKGEYARRVAEGEAIGTVSLMDHFVAVGL